MIHCLLAAYHTAPWAVMLGTGLILGVTSEVLGNLAGWVVVILLQQLTAWLDRRNAARSAEELGRANDALRSITLHEGEQARARSVRVAEKLETVHGLVNSSMGEALKRLAVMADRLAVLEGTPEAAAAARAATARSQEHEAKQQAVDLGQGQK